jgi:hypothetical protein
VRAVPVTWKLSMIEEWYQEKCVRLKEEITETKASMTENCHGFKSWVK